MGMGQAILLGLIQGFTEFFPISSSGHLVMLKSLFRIHDPSVLFDVFLHVGTLIAVTVYFARDIVRLFTVDRKLLGMLAVALVPTFIIGYLCEDFFSARFDRVRVVGLMMALNGVALIIASIANKDADRCGPRKEPGIMGALFVGCAQGLSIIPGTSRSAMTLIASIFAGFDRDMVFRFTFLLSIPTVTGMTLVKLSRVGLSGLRYDLVPIMIGCVTAMVVSYVSLIIMRKAVLWNKLYPFGFYCAIVGGAVAFFLFRLK